MVRRAHARPAGPGRPEGDAVCPAGRRGPGRGGRAAGDDRAGPRHHHSAALRGELADAGFHAAIFDIGTYVNESSPIDVTEFLIALALGVHDVLGASDADRGPGFVGRLRNLLKQLKISVDVPGLSATVSRESLEVEAMGASMEVDLQRELRAANRS
jgi:hypothetical protein